MTVHHLQPCFTESTVLVLPSTPARSRHLHIILCKNTITLSLSYIVSHCTVLTLNTPSLWLLWFKPQAVRFKPGSSTKRAEDPSDVQLKNTSSDSCPNKRLRPQNKAYTRVLMTARTACQMGSKHILVHSKK